MEFRYSYQGTEHTVRLEPGADGAYTVTVGGRTYLVEVEHQRGGALILHLDGERVRAFAAATPPAPGGQQTFVALMDGSAHVYEFSRGQASSGRRRAAAGGDAGLQAQMPGQVRQVFVSEGDDVEEGQPLLILEAMKMEIRVAAPYAGMVARLFVQTGDTVERGQQLVEVTPS